MPTDADKYLKCIDFIVKNRPHCEIVLSKVKKYVEENNPSKHELKSFISSIMPTKMGGIYLEYSRSLNWLKNKINETLKNAD